MPSVIFSLWSAEKVWPVFWEMAAKAVFVLLVSVSLIVLGGSLVGHTLVSVILLLLGRRASSGGRSISSSRGGTSGSGALVLELTGGLLEEIHYSG
jgi:hypothetical protein